MAVADHSMRDAISCDICVIGAGSGGLSVAAAAAAFGRHVVLIEKHKMGGDCLNYGCVPSKALLAAARRADAMRGAGAFGIGPVEPVIDPRAVAAHVKDVIARIAPNDSVERFGGMGVQVIMAAGKFVDRRTVTAGEHLIRARRFVIATGSSPAIPPIPGLNDVAYFTNETIFDNTERIDHLIIIGGGPIGMEMAQAHRRLGARVTVVEGAVALGKDDPELTAVVLKQLKAEGIDIIEGATVTAVATTGAGLTATVSVGGETQSIAGSHLLLAVGRKGNSDGLGLESAGIETAGHAIKVNAGLKTTNAKVYAIGDVAGGPQFTHIANDDAGIVIRNALFRLPAKTTGRIVPWVTYTDPELAHVGLSEAEAAKAHGRVSVLRWSLHENDRAQAERTTSGHVKVVVDRKGRILGASIVGAHAGELIQMWGLAISQRMKIRAMLGWISPYPTLSEVNKRTAFRYYATSPGNPFVRKLIAWLARLG